MGKLPRWWNLKVCHVQSFKFVFFFYKNLNHLVRPTLPGQSLVINWFLWRKYFAGFLMSFTLFNQWHYNTSLCSFGHFPNYLTKFFIANFPKVYVKLSRILGAHFMTTSIHKILYNRKRNKMLLQKWTKLPTAYRRGEGRRFMQRLY